MRDSYHNISAVTAIPPQVLTASAVDSSVIDLLGFNSVTFVVEAGSITDGSYAISVKEGAAADGSDGTTVAASDLLGTLPNFAASDDNKTKRFGYAGSQRYLKITLTPSGATTGGHFAAVAVLGSPLSAPVA